MAVREYFMQRELNFMCYKILTCIVAVSLVLSDVSTCNSIYITDKYIVIILRIP